MDIFIAKEHFVFCWINSIFILCKLPWVQSFVSLSKSSGYRGECKMYIEVGNVQSNMDNCVMILAASLCWLIIRIICGDRWPAPLLHPPHPIHHTECRHTHSSQISLWITLLLHLSIFILIIFGGVFLVVFWNINPRIPELKKYFNKSKSCQKYEGRRGRHNRRAAIWRLKC